MIERTLFKDKPILVITDDEKKYRRISIGTFKAKLILKNLEEIKKFVDENEGDIKENA
jgi:hypothetical protein